MIFTFKTLAGDEILRHGEIPIPCSRDDITQSVYDVLDANPIAPGWYEVLLGDGILSNKNRIGVIDISLQPNQYLPEDLKRLGPTKFEGEIQFLDFVTGAVLARYTTKATDHWEVLDQHFPPLPKDRLVRLVTGAVTRLMTRRAGPEDKKMVLDPGVRGVPG